VAFQRPGLPPAARAASTSYVRLAATALELPDHMNGRIYDPLLGRFLSADLVVQAPGNLQAYNRYSYVRNNPLTYTDKSGFWIDVKDEERKKKAAETKQPQKQETHEQRLENRKITITFTAAIINNSGQKISSREMSQLASRFEKALEKAFTGKDKNGNQWKMDAKIRVIEKGDEKTKSEHLISITNLNPDPKQPLVAGEGAYRGNEIRMEANIRSLTPDRSFHNTSFERTAAHEGGHTMGLLHPDDPNATPTSSKENLMWPSKQTDGMKIETPQIQSIRDQFFEGKLNQGLTAPDDEK
jgi:RHS repeat-associated protein